MMTNTQKLLIYQQPVTLWYTLPNQNKCSTFIPKDNVPQAKWRAIVSSSIKRYRRVSVTQADGREGKYDARVDIDVDSETGIVIYRVHSQVLANKHVPVRSSGNAADDAERLEQACQQVYDFDQGYRVRAWPKPQRSTDAAAQRSVQPACELCGDLGFVEDETGYPMVCSCRE